MRMIKACMIVLQTASLKIPFIDKEREGRRKNVNKIDTREYSGLDEKDSVQCKRSFQQQLTMLGVLMDLTHCIADKIGALSNGQKTLDGIL